MQGEEEAKVEARTCTCSDTVCTKCRSH